MSNKEFLNRIKNIDMIYKTDENGNVSEIISCGKIYKNHFKELESDLEVLEEIKKNHPDLYNLYKKMKEAERKWLDNAGA